MSRRIRKAEEIRNPEHYFNKYIAMEIRKDREKEEAYYEMFDSLEELTGPVKGKTHESLMLLATNLDGTEFDRYLSDAYPLAWIELIENPILYAAVKSLQDKDKWLLTLRYKYCLSQREIAPILHMTQSAICQREQAIKKIIRRFFKNAYQKP